MTSLLELVLVAGGVGLAGVAAGVLVRRRAPRTGSAGVAAQEVHVRVKGGFEPERIVVEGGRPVRLLFRREESSPDSERVVFPDLGRSASLPAYREVAIELPPVDPGEYEFTCETGMLRGHLVVAAASVPEASFERSFR